MNELEVLLLRASTLLVRVGGLNVLTDPWFAGHLRGLPAFVRPCLRPEELPPLDIVLISHFHPDHFDCRALRRLRQPCGVMVGPPGLPQRMFGLRCREALVLRDGETAVAAGMGISAFAVEHSGYENAYLVEYGELSFFFAGDAKYSPAFATVGRAHQPLISFLPVGGTEILGRRVVMGPEDALQAALDLGTRVVTPIHSGGEWLSLPPLSRHPGRAARLAALAERSKAPFRAVVLAPGERASIAADGSVIRRTRERGDGR